MTHRIPYFWLLVFLLTFFLLTSGGRIALQDEETTFRMAANLIEYGRLTITQQTITLEPQAFPAFLPQSRPRELITTWAGPGIDGQTYPEYTHGQALLDVPLYLIGRIFSGPPASLEAVALLRSVTALLNPILIALNGWLLALTIHAWGGSTRLSGGLGLAYSLGSMALAYASTHFSEPLLALLITLAIYGITRAKASHDRAAIWMLIAGAALGYTIFTRERSIIWLPAFLIYLLITRRHWRAIDWAAFGLPIVAAGLAIGAWNWARFGSPLVTAYAAWQPETGFSVPILLGAYGLLLSPGKGLLLYNVIAWLGVVGLLVMLRRRFAEAVLLILLVVISIVFFARYDLWTGGWNWGPRYLLPIVPALILAVAAWLIASPSKPLRVVVLALCVTGVALNIPAVLVEHSHYMVGFGERDPQHYLNRSVLRLEDSPLTRQWPAVFEMAALYTRPETWAAARQSVQQHLESYSGPADLEALSTHLVWVDEFFRLNVPDFWFVYLPLLGFSPWVVGLLALALLALALVSGWKVFQMLR